jgi:hypothetical protein
VLIWWGRIRIRDRRRLLPRSLTILCIAASAFLTGCGAASGGTGAIKETVTTAVEDSSTAIATARLALKLDRDGKLTTAATSTTLDDALKELETSRDSVLRLAPTSPEGRSLRQETLTVLDGCAASLTTARDAVSSEDGTPSLADGDHELEAAETSLSAVSQKVGAQ